MQRLIPTLHSDGVPQELINVIDTLLAGTKELAFRISQGVLGGVLGSTLDENVQGETQKKLDVLANNLLKDLLAAEPQVLAVASEEEPTSVACNPKGNYVVAFDPLDGSSNIDINGQIGTIFTIYKALKNVPAESEQHFLQAGTEQVCAGYVLYGPSTLLVMSTGGPTRCFTLDITHGSYLLTQPALVIPADTAEFSVNMSNQRFWADACKHYIADLMLGEQGVRAKRFNMRWNGAMVGDVHRVLQRGGIFLYPNDNRNPKQPSKLRLLYEANPMAMLVEHAGGLAVAEGKTILALQPESLHQRVEVVLGSKNEVEAYLKY